MHISEKDGKVTIDGFEFYGHIEENFHCKNCQAPLAYYEEFDALFCPKCNDWTEQKCANPRCYYCPNRPEKPLVYK